MVDGTCRTDKGRVLADVTTGYGDWQVALDQAIEWVPSEDTQHGLGAMERVNGEMLPWMDGRGRGTRVGSPWITSGLLLAFL